MTKSAEKLKGNPTKRFSKPSEVLEAADLDARQKLEILKNWENEAHQLQTATEENMYGGEDSRLEDVREAIDRLSKQVGLGDDHKPGPAKP